MDVAIADPPEQLAIQSNLIVTGTVTGITVTCNQGASGWVTFTPATGQVILSDGTRIFNTSTSNSTTNTSLTSGIWVNGLIYNGSTNFTTSTTASHYWAGTSGAGMADINWRAVHKHVKPGVKKTTRNSIKRALKLMTGLGFEEEARIFLKGDVIEVSHPDSMLKFVIRKYERSLISRTERPGYSTPYALSLHTKGDQHVADLCVYMDKTPVLDQVLGVALFIRSGDEEMILRKANWSRLTSDMEMREIIALEHPGLVPKLRLSEKKILANEEQHRYQVDRQDTWVAQSGAVTSGRMHVS